MFGIEKKAKTTITTNKNQQKNKKQTKKLISLRKGCLWAAYVLPCETGTSPPSHLTMDGPPSGTSSPVIREPSRERPRAMKWVLTTQRRLRGSAPSVVPDFNLGRKVPYSWKSNFFFFWNTQTKSYPSRSFHLTSCEYLLIKCVSIWGVALDLGCQRHRRMN